MEIQHHFFQSGLLRDDEVRDKRIGNAQSFSSYFPGKDNPRRKWKMNSTFFSIRSLKVNEIRDHRIGNAQSFSTHIPGNDNSGR